MRLSRRRLADAAEVSVDTIYNLIGPHDAVVAALVTQVIDVIEPAVGRVGGDDPLARCVAVIDRSASVVIENAALTRPLAQEIFGHRGPGSEVSRRWGTDTLRRAHGATDGEGFRAAALHGLHLALSAVATDETRPHVQRALADASRRLDATLDVAPDPASRQTA